MGLVKKALSYTTCLSVALSCVLPPPAFANPQGGVVSAGQATISQSGTTLDVNQQSNRVVIDWRGFDIAPNETTQFFQPSAGAIALSRVNSNSATNIQGTLLANGNIIIINQNGVMFGAGSKVDVNGLVATTANIGNNAFMNAAGNTLTFDQPGNPNASIINNGTITAGQAGLVGLVAPNVINNGVITAKLGKIQLASGDTATVDMYGDSLMEVAVSDKVKSQLVANNGLIEADGGKVALTAAAGSQIVNSLITVPGEIKTPAVAEKDGVIYIYAEGANAVPNNVAANKGQKSGSSEVLVSGTLDASSTGTGQTGGNITVTGDHVGILSGAVIDASGDAGGGTIQIGGDFHGQATTPTTQATIIQQGATINASAVTTGNGGNVTVWADDYTDFEGFISAKGGSGSGNGGNVETSGKQSLIVAGTVDASAPKGNAGSWLLDPADLTITASTTSGTTTSSGSNPITWATTGGSNEDSMSAATIDSELNAGTSVIIETSNTGSGGNGDINVNAAISKTAGSDATLSLNAYNDIAVNAPISSSSNKLNVVMNSGNSSEVDVNADIVTNGGGLTINGGLTTNTATLNTSAASGTAGAISINGSLSIIAGGAMIANGENGGAVMLTAPNIMHYGSITADGTNGNGGTVTFDAQDIIHQTTQSIIDVSGTESGGGITISAGPSGSSLYSSGTYLANGNTGGSITITGDTLTLAAATLDASGTNGGGTVLIGGEAHGGGSVQHATSTLVNPYTNINADATDNGNGGKVVVWSDDSTQFYGTISARGGANGGNGGFMETSSADRLTFGGFADAGAANGIAGSLLLDPKNITISTGAPSSGSYIQLTDPNASTSYGTQNLSLTLSTNNIVVLDKNATIGGVATTGAVYLFNGTTGALISELDGSHAGDLTVAGFPVALTALTGNGNFVVNAYEWNSWTGASIWGSGTTGVSGVISSSNALVGTTSGTSTTGDAIGHTGTIALSNGNYVVDTAQWNGGTTNGYGAVTWGNGSTGTTGVVSSSNSLVGSNVGDLVGNTVTALTGNGNYVVDSYHWNTNEGAVTWGNGSTGVTGVVSSANSLVGSTSGTSTTGDQIGLSLSALTDGNYVVTSSYWSGGSTNGYGAVTWGSGTSGISGVVSSSNSLVGSNVGDLVGTNITALTGNGNYVVGSYKWNGYKGAATWGSGSTGVTGVVSSSNSLVGSTGGGAGVGDSVAIGGILALTNGNYVVESRSWNGGGTHYGAATFGCGSSSNACGVNGVSGTISSSNSLVGSHNGDSVGYTGTIALTNGNYVVGSNSSWNGNEGSATWGNGTTGTTGVVSSSNSLVGSTGGDYVGTNVYALTNGNYVVDSSFWNGGGTNYGAVTWVNGTTGATSDSSNTISSSNSLVGSHNGDMIGYNGHVPFLALSNGNYVVGSNRWNTYEGAVTWGNGSTGTTGVVSSSNSLVGSTTGTSTTGDNVGNGVVVAVALSNGNYVVTSSFWSGGQTNGYGAATWGSGTSGVSGVVSSSNSLVGSNSGDEVGSGGVTALTGNGNYVVDSYHWNTNEGAVTWGNGSTGVTGVVSSANSLVGSTSGTSTTGDQIGLSLSALTDGNYVVVSKAWTGGTTNGLGAVTWGSGVYGVTGVVSGSNSLVGTNVGDRIGSGSINATNFTNGGFAVLSPLYNSGVGRVDLFVDNSTPNKLYSDSAATDVTINTAAITAITNTGTAVILQANNDITLNSSSNITTSHSGSGGALTLDAGRSILLNSNITTDGGALTLLANDTAADGVIDADRASGAAVITMANGTTLNSGAGAMNITIGTGAGNTNDTSGDITLYGITAGALTVANNGPSNGNIVFNNALTLGGTGSVITGGGAVTFASTINGGYGLTVNAGAGAVTFDAALGGSTPLSSLTVTGSTTLDGNVTTGGNQTYNSAVTIAGADTLNSSFGNGNITFAAAVNDNTANTDALTVNAGTGTITFGAAVGATAKLASLTVTGPTILDANVTTGGNQIYNSAVTIAGSDTLNSSFANGNITFASTVDDTTANTDALVVNAGTGIITFTGNVGTTKKLAGLTATGPTILDANVTTGGNQTYNSAVTIAGADTLTSSFANGNITFASTVDDTTANTDALVVNAGTGTITFSGNVGTTKKLASLTVTGPTILDANVTTGGNQTYNSAVTIAGADTLSSSFGGGNITFASTVDDTTANTDALVVNAGTGTITFDAAVGGSKKLASLTVTGPTILDANVTTGGNQTYNSAVTIAGPDTLSSSFGGGNITFASTVNDTSANTDALVVNTGTGTVTFDSTVGATAKLASLTATGPTILDANVTTGGNQTYNSAVTIAGADTLSSSFANGNITFASTVDDTTANTDALVVNAGTGTVTFTGSVGATKKLASLTTTGPTILDANVTTGGNQTYNNAVTIAGADTLSSSFGNGNITFASTVDDTTANTDALVVNAGTGTITFGAAVGATAKLASLTTTGPTILDANVTTGGNQTYNSAVTIAGPDTLSSSFGGGNITFASTVNDTSANTDALVVNTGTGTVTFDSTVGATAKLASLTATGPTILDANVTTGGNQTYNSAVTIAGADTLSSSFANGNITFASTVDDTTANTDALVVNAGTGTVTFTGSVGATKKLASLTTTGPTILDANVTTGGNQTYNNAVTIAGADTLSSSFGNGNITFASTVDDTTANTDALVVNAGTGTITFGAAVGATAKLASLTTTGPTILDANVTTGGNQTYNSAVTIAGPDTLSSGFANGNITFASTVNDTTANTDALVVNAGAGTITFTGNVGTTKKLASLTVTGPTILDANVTTGGNQTYNSAVTIAGPDTLSSGFANGNITFASTVNDTTANTDALVVNAGAGTITFTGNVGTTKKLASLTVTGPTILDANVTTGGNQIYNSAVTIAGADTLSSSFANGNITFASTVDDTTANTDALVVNAGTGTVTFDSTVGATAKLASLTATGPTILDANVTTGGNQTYNSAVTIAGSDTLSSSFANGNITFASTVNDTSANTDALVVNTGTGTVTFDSTVGATAKLASLTATGPTILDANVTTGGNQTYNSAVTIAGADTLSSSFANGNITFASTVDDTTANTDALVVNAGTGTITFGAAVGATAKLASLTTTGPTILDANVTTGGNQTYNSAVTIAGADTLSSGFANGNITFASTVNDTTANTDALVVNAGTGTITFTSNVGTTKKLASLTVTGPIILDANVTTGGNQTYNSAVTIAGPDTLSSGFANGNITFASTVNDTTANTDALVVNAGAGTITFTGNVGTTKKLASLTVTGPTILDANVTTGGNQIYNSAVTIAGADTLSSSFANGNITFASTVDDTTANTDALVVNAGTGTVTFDSTVGATAKLASLTATGPTILDANVTTGGNQTYNSAVTIAGSDTLSSSFANGNITFASTVDDTTANTDALVVNAGTGTVTFDSTVGATAKLASLTATGPTILDANVTTGGNQTYNSAVTIAGPDTLSSSFAGGNITFASTVDDTTANTDTLVINAGSGTVTFDSTVGATAKLASLTATGPTILDANVTTGGNQTYNSAVTIAGADTLSSSFANGNITFASTVDDTTANTDALVVNAGTGTITFGAAVGGTKKLASLTATGPTILDANVTTGGNQTYNSAVTIAGSDTLSSSFANGNITFASTVDDTTANTDALVVNAGTGTVTFDSTVGATAKLASLTATGPTILDANVTTGGNQTYNSAVTIAGPDTLSSSFAGGNITFASTVDDTTANTDTLVINAGSGLITFGSTVGATKKLASLAASSTTDIDVNGNVTTGGTQTYAGPVVLGASDTLTTTNSNVHFTGSVDGTGSGAQSLTVSDGTATTTFGSTIGATTPLNNLTLTDDNIIFGDNIKGAGQLTIQASTVSQALNMNNGTSGLYLSTTEIGYIQNDWAAINIGNSSDTGTMTLGSATWVVPTTFTTNSSGVISIIGTQTGTGSASLNFTGPTTLGYAGTDVVTANQNITFNSAVTLSSNSTINSGTATTDFASTVAAGSHDLTLTGDHLTLGGNMTGTGVLTIQPFTIGTNLHINDGTSSGLFLTGAETGFINNASWSSITFGNAFDTGNMTVGTTTWNAPLTLLNDSGIIEFAGAQTLGGNTLTAVSGTGNIQLDLGATITSTATSGYAIILAASGGNFINNSGSNSPLATGTGAYWAVYSTADANDINGGSVMNPTTTVYNTAYPTTTGQSGNTWFYNSSQNAVNEGTIDITATAVSATYGDTLGALAYTCMQGGIACSAGILADLTGVLGVINESGGTATASTQLVHASNFDVNGSSNNSGTAGQYNIVRNTLTWLAGYTGTIDYTSAVVILAAKALNATGFTVSGKTYNASTVAAITSNGALTGSGSTSGDGKYITGDDISIAAGGSATFGSANAGSETATGSLTLAGSQAADYTLTAPTASATIATENITIKATDQSQTYGFGGTGAALGTTGYTVTSGTVYNTDITGVTLATNATGSTSGNYNAGTWNITPAAASGSGATNYNVSYTTDTNGLVIAKKTLTDPGFAVAGRQYDGQTDATITNNGTLSGVVTGLANGGGSSGNGLTDSVSLSSGSATFGSKNAGSETATGSHTLAGNDANDYTLAAPTANATITKATLDITANAQSATYGDTLGALTYNYSGLQSGDAINGGALGVTDENSVTKAAGTVLSHANGFDVASSPFGIIQNTLGVSDGNSGNNYTIVYTGANVTLAAKTLTDTGFAVSGRAYNGLTSAAISSNGALTGGGSISSDGEYITGDVVSIAGGGSAAFGSRNAGPQTATGSLTLAGGQAGDYTLTAPTANATISQEGLTITAQTGTKTYDGNTASIVTPTITGGTLGAGDTAGFSETYGSKNAGTGLTLTASGSVSDGNGGNNYSYSFVTDGTGVITAKALTVTANNQTIIVGNPDPALTYSYTGLVGGDGSAGFTGALSRTAGDNVGTYSILQGTLAATGNYSIGTYNPGSFTINAFLASAFSGADIPSTVLMALQSASRDTDGQAYGDTGNDNVGTYSLTQNLRVVIRNYSISTDDSGVIVIGINSTTEMPNTAGIMSQPPSFEGVINGDVLDHTNWCYETGDESFSARGSGGTSCVSRGTFGSPLGRSKWNDRASLLSPDAS